MVTVGIRELKQQTSELIRQVREDRIEIRVTHRGKIVALIIPVAPASQEEIDKLSWSHLDTLAAEIGARWPKGVSAII
jgi:prevent-host-death family protein